MLDVVIETLERIATPEVMVAKATRPLCALIVDRSDIHARLLVWELERGGFETDYTRVDSLYGLSKALRAVRADVVISDYQTPGLSAMTTLETVKREQPDLPLIIVAGRVGEDAVVELMKAGACDYVFKGNLTALVPAVEKALCEMKARKESVIDIDCSGKVRGFDSLRKLREGTVNALACVTELRDPYTAGHQRRVTQLAVAIAEKMGLSEAEIEGIRIAGTLHDIGKIYVPAEILSRPSRLSETEMNLIKEHPRVCQDILMKIEFPWPICDIIVQHHERMDGSGYPAHLPGDCIKREARILAVADVVEAMSSHRPYRPALGITKALDEISQNKGTLYDTEAVEICLGLFQEEAFKFV